MVSSSTTLKDCTLVEKLLLVEEIPYNKGIVEFVGGRSKLRRQGNKIGKLLENASGVSKNCLIEIM